MKKALNFARLLFHKANALPVYLIHYVNLSCNARCPHCFIDFDNGPKFDDLTLPQIQKFTQHLGPNLYSAMLTGGEPFLRRDLTDVVRAYFDNSGVHYVQVNTNGSLPRRVMQTVDTITRQYPDRQFGIAMSLDGIGEDHDTNRRIPGLFQKCAQLHRQLRQIQAERPNFQLSINVTVSNFNQDKLPEIFRYLTREMGASNVFSTLTRGEPVDVTAKKVDLAKYEAFTRQTETSLKGGSLSGFYNFLLADAVNAQNIITRERVLATVQNGRFQGPCYAGGLSGVIFNNGKVAACEAAGKDDVTMHEDDYLMGDLHDYAFDLVQLWQSPRASWVRQQIAATRCFCTHECFLVTNVLFNPRYGPRLVKEMVSMKVNRLATSFKDNEHRNGDQQ